MRQWQGWTNKTLQDLLKCLVFILRSTGSNQSIFKKRNDMNNLCFGKALWLLCGEQIGENPHGYSWTSQEAPVVFQKDDNGTLNQYDPNGEGQTEVMNFRYLQENINQTW